MVPIWKDTYYSAVTDGFEFTVTEGSDEIYRGMASPYPDGVAVIPLNSICSSHLDSSLPDFREIADSAVSQSDACKEFSLNQVSGSSSTAVTAYTFYNGWAYAETSGDTLSAPINGHMDKRMKLFYTVAKNNAGQICYEV